MIALTVKHLRYFDALARHAHFGRAAEACAITQPALSMQIKELETLLGAPLVERTPRQMRLTSLGEQFLARARKIMLEVDEIGELSRSAQSPLAGRLRLGVIPTIAPYLLPEMIKALLRRFPELQFQLRESVTRTLIGDLLESRLDAAIVALPISEPGLHEYRLFAEDFVLVRPREDEAKPVPAPKDLGKMGLLLLEEGHCFRDQALSFCQLRSAEPHSPMEGSSLATLVQMVGAGMGLTLIPEMARALETAAALVSVARFPAPAPSRTIGLVWRKTNPLSDQLMQIGDLVRQVGQSRPDQIGVDGALAPVAFSGPPDEPV
jgi:LysR family hydrogen peroxide-inducible transcriptional activator